MLIFLLGFMGSGKSFTGKRLAEKFGIDFVDLDEYIETKEGQTIREIFEEHGEAYFRKKEKQYLQELGERKMTIVATGGGAPCFFDNMEWMNNHGVTVYLETPAPVLAKRLEQEMEKRPLLKKLTRIELQDFIDKKLVERNPFYHQCQVLYEQKEDGRDVAEDLRRYFYRII